MKVLIAIPALDTVHTDFAMSLAAMLTARAYDKKLRREVDVAISCTRGTLIMHSRNILMQQAVDANATHILYLDSDMVFPPDALSRLIAHHVPIVGADYLRRVAPFPMNGSPRDDYPAYSGQLLRPMLTLPFGCILIKLSVLADLPRPWFAYIEGDSDATTLSEDTFFCNRVRQAGHTIWQDVFLTAQIGHIGTHIYRPMEALP